MKKQKLSLNRETLRQLEPARAEQVLGGGTGESCLCPTQAQEPGTGGGGSIWSGPVLCLQPTFTCNTVLVSGCALCN